MIICVLMRFGSQRLPGKALIDLGGGLTSMELLVEQLRFSRFKTIICCPEGEEDDLIAERAEALNDCDCFRGPLEGVVERMVLAAEHYDSSSFVRVTGDDLFVDPYRLDQLADAHGDADYTFSDLPKGTETVVVNADFARQLIADSTEDSTEYWDKRRGVAWDRANLNFVPLSPVVADDNTFALELDTPEDADTIRKTLKQLKTEEKRQPFVVEDLAEMHREKPFPKSKPPVDMV